MHRVFADLTDLRRPAMEHDRRLLVLGRRKRGRIVMGEPEHDPTLARLAQRAPGKAGEIVRALLVEFRGPVGRLVATHEVNRTLPDRSLEVVNGSLALFRAVAGANRTSGQRGCIEESGPALMALSRMT